MAGNKTIGGLGAAAAAADEDLIEVEQGGVSKKMALAALALFLLPTGLPDIGPIQDQIDAQSETISTLQDSFGSATSAAAAAAAAETARLAAVAARGQAEEIVQGATQVGIDAIDARNAAQAARDLAAAAQADAEAAQADAETAALASAGSASASGASATSAAGSASTATTQAAAAGTSASAAAASATVATTKAADASTSAAAAASSASTAATSATSAGTSASSATTSANTATTQAGIATTQAGIATTQAGNAATSASAASTSASNAAASQTAAGTSASAAASSATSAATQAGNAATSAGAASTSASNASTSASQASTSATNAAGSASTAATQATNAANSATTAGTSASAASTSASSAATQASNAATSASTASTQATNAATSATAAAGSASAASTSASTASTQATNASNSASAANTSSVSAQSVANRLLPDRPAIKADFTPLYSAGTPPDTSAIYTAGTVVAVTGEGDVLQDTVGREIFSRGWLPVGTGRTFRTEHRLRITVNGVNTAVTLPALFVYDASAAFLGPIGWVSYSAQLAAAGWVSRQADYTSSAIISAYPTAAYVRAAVGVWNSATNGDSGATWQIAFLRLRDVTSETAAATSASAASTSASAASTSASNAATSASSATTSANTATTQAGNASTSATAAATSATSAAGSASSASSSATLAANSSGAATLTGAALFPSDFINGGEFWHDGYTGAPGSHPLSSNANVTYPTVAGIGTVAQWANIVATSSDVASKGWIKLVAGRSYKASASIRNTVLNGTGPKLYVSVIGLDASGNYATEITANSTLALNTWTTVSVTGDGSTFIAAGAVYARALARFLLVTNTGSSTAQWAWVKFEDVTDSTASAGSASAAATSASSASTSASGAAASATSATSSANTASTQAGNASTSASSASSSAAAASASASSASSSATLAAQVGQGALNANPIFAAWSNSGGLPDSWANYYTNSGYSRGSGGKFGSPYYLNWATNSGAYYGGFDAVPNITPGSMYVMAVDIKWVSGASLDGAGIEIDWLNAAGTYLGQSYFLFSVTPTAGGAIASAAGYDYAWRRMVVAPATAVSAQIYLMQNFVGWGDVTKTLRWYQASLRPVTDMEAAVTTSSGVVVDVAARIATAQWEAVTSVGGAAAAIRLESKSIGGTASSSVALEAYEIQLWNDVAGTRKKALSVVGGDAIFYGSITAEAGIFLGTGIKWSPQLQMKDFQVTDGQAVSFGYDLGNTPLFDFKGNGLAPLATGETYHLYADSASKTGFTARLRISTPGATTSYSLTTDTTPGTGPTRQIDKASNPDANTNIYTFRVQGSFTDVAFTTGGGGGGGWGPPGGGGQIP